MLPDLLFSIVFIFAVLVVLFALVGALGQPALDLAVERLPLLVGAVAGDCLKSAFCQRLHMTLLQKTLSQDAVQVITSFCAKSSGAFEEHSVDVLLIQQALFV